jgi:hypothetical protein
LDVSLGNELYSSTKELIKYMIKMSHKYKTVFNEAIIQILKWFEYDERQELFNMFIQYYLSYLLDNNPHLESRFKLNLLNEDYCLINMKGNTE